MIAGWALPLICLPASSPRQNGEKTNGRDGANSPATLTIGGTADEGVLLPV